MTGGEFLYLWFIFTAMPVGVGLLYYYAVRDNDTKPYHESYHYTSPKKSIVHPPITDSVEVSRKRWGSMMFKLYLFIQAISYIFFALAVVNWAG